MNSLIKYILFFLLVHLYYGCCTQIGPNYENCISEQDYPLYDELHCRKVADDLARINMRNPEHYTVTAIMDECVYWFFYEMKIKYYRKLLGDTEILSVMKGDPVHFGISVNFYDGSTGFHRGR